MNASASSVIPFTSARSEPLPPHSPEGEQGLLGCLMLSPLDAIQEIEQAEIAPDHFYDLRHRRIFQTIRSMIQGGAPVNLLTLHDKLRQEGVLEQVGGISYVGGLEDCTPSAANAGYYIDILREQLARRSMVDTAEQLGAAAREPNTPVRLLLDGADRTLRQLYLQAGLSAFPEVISASHFLARTETAPTELIESLLHRGSKMVIGGGSKSYKTWALLDLALSVSQGEPWLGFKTNRGRVLYVNLEVQDWAFHKRIEKVAAAKGLSEISSHLDLWNLRGYSCDPTALIQRIGTRAKQHDYSMVIIDPIYKLYGTADENSASDVARLLNQLEGLARRGNLAVVFGAHFSKGNQAAKENLDRVSGSGVFARDPDTCLIITPHEEKDAYAIEGRLRNHQPLEPFVARWNFPLFHRDCGLDPRRLRGGADEPTTPEDLLALLPDDGLGHAEWIGAAEQQLGIAQSTYYRLREQLTRRGEVTREGKRFVPSSLPSQSSFVALLLTPLLSFSEFSSHFKEWEENSEKEDCKEEYSEESSNL